MQGSDMSIRAGEVIVRARAIAKNFSTYPIFADNGATLVHPSVDGFRRSSRSFLATTGALPA